MGNYPSHFFAGRPTLKLPFIKYTRDFYSSYFEVEQFPSH